MRCEVSEHEFEQAMAGWEARTGRKLKRQLVTIGDPPLTVCFDWDETNPPGTSIGSHYMSYDTNTGKDTARVYFVHEAINGDTDKA